MTPERNHKRPSSREVTSDPLIASLSRRSMPEVYVTFAHSCMCLCAVLITWLLPEMAQEFWASALFAQNEAPRMMAAMFRAVVAVLSVGSMALVLPDKPAAQALSASAPLNPSATLDDGLKAGNELDTNKIDEPEVEPVMPAIHEEGIQQSDTELPVDSPPVSESDSFPADDWAAAPAPPAANKGPPPTDEAPPSPPEADEDAPAPVEAAPAAPPAAVPAADEAVPAPADAAPAAPPAAVPAADEAVPAPAADEAVPAPADAAPAAPPAAVPAADEAVPAPADAAPAAPPEAVPAADEAVPAAAAALAANAGTATPVPAEDAEPAPVATPAINDAVAPAVPSAAATVPAEDEEAPPA